MKNVNTLKKAIINPLMLTLYGALLGVFISYIIKPLSQLPINPSWLILLLLVLVIIFVSLILVKLQEMDKTIQKCEANDERIFKILNANDASLVAAHNIEKASIVRVIGTARQDIINTQNVKEADKYLASTEKRFLRKKHLIYRRITSSKLRTPFKEHLNKLSELSKSNNHDFKIAFIDSIETTISYQIFDENEVLVIIDTPLIENIRDNALSLLSTNLDIVRSFVLHFETAWERLTPSEVDKI